MAGTVNKVILIGRLGQEVSMKYTPNGNAVASFTLATDESYKKDGQKVEQTEWHHIVMYGKSAEIANEYLKKGSQLYVEGRLKTREYTDRENIRRKQTEVVSESFTMLDGKSKGEQRPTQENPILKQAPIQKPTRTNEEYTATIEEDLPF